MKLYLLALPLLFGCLETNAQNNQPGFVVVAPPVNISEPGTLALMGIGAALVGIAVRKRK